ncbi:DUF6850 family outer membrane beta-barrel protein, partial [Gemmatimonas sp.]|uniref:DUF6850 family outer membrane beta-barrel protein n=1 Tax=Gemmatimonas sp. TaxID=1962908 RepID=UPI00391AA539
TMFLGVATARAQDGVASGWGRAPDATAATASSTAAWMHAWSPLRSTGDVVRGLLRAPLAPSLLTAPAPRAGAFVLAGAPGALGRDLAASNAPRGFSGGDSARFGEVRLRTASETGSYRRPLDMAEAQATQVSGGGYAPVGRRGVVMGQFTVDREQHEQSAFAQRVAVYGSSPFVVTDSVTPPMQRTRARLEGALGLRLGQFGVGASAALESREHFSVDFPLRRTGRHAVPALSAGIERVLPWFAARVGTYFRWTEPVETNSLNPSPLATNVYQIQGYDEPVGLIIASGNQLFVRNENRATAIGGTAEATVLGARIVLVHEQADRREDQYFQITSRTRPTDRWRADGADSRVQVQRTMGGRGLLTFVGSRQTVSGTASRQDLTGIVFEGRDEALSGEADVRWRFSPRWQAAAMVGGMQRRFTREDFVVALRTRIESSTPFAGGEVARSFGAAVADGATGHGVALGGSWAAVAPAGAIPAVTNRGASYRRLIAPSLSYDLAQSRAVAAWVTVRTRLGATPLWASVRIDQVQPATEAASRLQPAGERSVWSLSLGLRP